MDLLANWIDEENAELHVSFNGEEYKLFGARKDVQEIMTAINTLKWNVERDRRALIKLREKIKELAKEC